jgi:hypothetical protein
MKKDWEAPKLIVIVRAELEEDVLAGCKVTVQTCDENTVGPTLGTS